MGGVAAPGPPGPVGSGDRGSRAAPVSLVATRMPRTSLRPSSFTPVAISTTALITRPATLADLHRQRIGGDEGERVRLAEGSVAELVDVLVELGCHAGDLRLR